MLVSSLLNSRGRRIFLTVITLDGVSSVWVERTNHYLQVSVVLSSFCTSPFFGFSRLLFPVTYGRDLKVQLSFVSLPWTPFFESSVRIAQDTTLPFLLTGLPLAVLAGLQHSFLCLQASCQSPLVLSLPTSPRLSSYQITSKGPSPVFLLPLLLQRPSVSSSLLLGLILLGTQFSFFFSRFFFLLLPP